MFSDEQEQAIHTKANQVLVAAPPGSGKTRVIVGRVNYLISQGVDPTSIYAITFTNMAAQEMLSRVDYPIFIGTIHRLANSILKSNGVDTSRVIEEEQFDILLEQVKEGYIELPKITHLLVDELQDVGDVQFEFITKTLCAKNLFLVGDDCQCQPAGTMIRLRDNIFKPIEEIEVGDSVVWYTPSSGYISGPTAKTYNSIHKRVEKISSRTFVNDNLITITTEKGEKSTYTPNHKTFIRLKETKYEHVVYLMCDENFRFRIGKSTTYRSKKVGSALPWRTKMWDEGGVKGWLLKAFETDREARVWEAKLSYQYNIPQTCWQLDKVRWTQEDLDFIYSELDTKESAIQLLKRFNRDIKYPLIDWSDDSSRTQHFAKNAVTEIYACNIMPDIMEALVYVPENEKERRKEYQAISKVDFNFITEPILVYSLKVEGETYVADNIITHNSIYSFNGGNPENFTNFLNEPETTLYELTNNYRNAKSIYSFASSFIRGMQEVYHIQTVIKREGGEVYKEPYSDNRVIDLLQENEDYGNWFILTRTNAEVSEIRGLLHSEGIPSTTFKKSEKTFEELQEEMKKNTVKVLTIHSAKGLEADKVMIIGARTFNNEEKRVCYVAITRARDKVYWFDKVKPKYVPRKYKQDINKGHATMTW